MMSHKAGCTARVISSYGSCRSLRISASATASDWETNATVLLEIPRGAARSDSVCIVLLLRFLAGELDEHIVERRVRTERRSKRAGSPQACDAAGVHERHRIAQFVGFFHIVRRHEDRRALARAQRSDV